MNFERQRSKDAGGFFGVKNSDGVGFKSHHGKRGSLEHRDIACNFNVLLVPDVDAVEVSDSEDAAIGQLTKLRYSFQDFHNQGLSYLVRAKSE